MSVAFETLNQTGAAALQTPPTSGISTTLAQGSQPTLLEPPLATTHRAHRTTEGAGYIILIRPTLVHQANHSVGFSHRVAYRIVSQHYA
jgi:hypothetical protein